MLTKNCAEFSVHRKWVRANLYWTTLIFYAKCIFNTFNHSTLLVIVKKSYRTSWLYQSVRSLWLQSSFCSQTIANASQVGIIIGVVVTNWSGLIELCKHQSRQYEEIVPCADKTHNLLIVSVMKKCAKKKKKKKTMGALFNAKHFLNPSCWS
jgi:uncharacterized membrane protein YcjF (UPF0283 family)